MMDEEKLRALMREEIRQVLMNSAESWLRELVQQEVKRELAEPDVWDALLKRMISATSLRIPHKPHLETK